MSNSKATFLVTCADPRLRQCQYHCHFPVDGYLIPVIGGSKGVPRRFEKVVNDILDFNERLGVPIAGADFYIIDHTTCLDFGGLETPDDHRPFLHQAGQLLRIRFREVDKIFLRVIDFKSGQLISIK